MISVSSELHFVGSRISKGDGMTILYINEGTSVQPESVCYRNDYEATSHS